MPKYKRLTPEELEQVRRDADQNEDPLRRLAAIKRGTEHWTALLHESVHEARMKRITWAAIAETLDVSLQAVTRRFRIRVTDDVEPE